jgi:FixJ family two-component response regulator
LKLRPETQPGSVTFAKPSDVIVIDDDPSVRKSIKRLLEAHGHSVQTCGSLDEFAAAGSIPQVGCVVLDLNLPGIDGLEIQAKLAVLAPTLSIVFLTGYGKVSASVRAMKAGAVDFLEKPVRAGMLIPAVEQAIARSRRLLQERVVRQSLQRRFDALTERERQVFSLITLGLLNKQAAAELGITEKTVKVHRARVMDKMGAGSLAELVKMSQRLGPKA